MKIRHIKLQNRFNLSKKNSIFLNLYYLFSLYRYIFVVLIGLVLSAFITLVTIDFLSPSLLKNIDKKTTLNLFDQLQEAKRYQDAIILMEYKAGFLNDSPLGIEYKSKLSDSYIKVGDYSKAEKMLLDVWNKFPQFISEEELKENDNSESLVDVSKFGIARQIYQFYEKMGDVKNQQRFFDIYKIYYAKVSPLIDSLMISTLNKRERLDLDTSTSKELIEYDSIVISSFKDKEKAIDGMEKYLDKIIDLKEVGRSYKVKCLNKLIGWHLENGHLPRAYTRISQAVELVIQMKSLSEYDGLGVLSDYCFQIHDIQTSKDLYSRYEKYVQSEYSPTDFEYLFNDVRKFRFLEQENRMDELYTSLVDYCAGMRNQITLNMPSMTSEQREYFAQTFNIAYDYAFTLLKSHPSEVLADLCFDNVTFKTGLLLRSNLSLRNSITNLNNPKANEMYIELDSCRRELIYQSVAGKKLFGSTKKLNKRIDYLEKNLALISTDFKQKNEVVLSDYKMIQDKLNSNEAMVELIQHKNDLLALILRNTGAVEYVPLCNIKEIKSDLQRPIFKIYHDVNFTDKILGKVKELLKEYRTIYYVPNGIYNQLALATFYLGNNQYVYDVSEIKLLSNPAVLLSKEDFKLKNTKKYISMWGGINYGGATDSNNESCTRTAIKRGENLSKLRYSLQEVKKISNMLTKNAYSVNQYTDSTATERTFKDRNNQDDYILHISTHGFFNDKVESSKSMYESGLFFAGANKYWSNDSITILKGKDDGILRAVEISTMNLSKCSLIVLSACETGLGFSHSSEGVYGLQRAFKLAGADQILMSLWDVDDQATSMLMTEFYKRLLLGEDSDRALKESKNAVRIHYPSPEDWGGFVLLH